jgi:hypothetical protein
MIRILGVVVVFLALNISGFFVYRSSFSVEAATISPSMMPHTFSREPSPSQPKLEDVSRAHPTTNVVQTPIAQPETHFTEPAVLPNTAPARVNAEVKHVRPRVEAVSHSSAPQVDAPAPVIEKKSADPATKPDKNSVLEMEGNPYKRGE